MKIEIFSKNLFPSNFERTKTLSAPFERTNQKNKEKRSQNFRYYRNAFQMTYNFVYRNCLTSKFGLYKKIEKSIRHRQIK